MSNASPLCVAIMERGPAWVGGRATREQPFWDEHAAFIDGLAAEGRVMLAGPFTDWTGALQILRGSVRGRSGSTVWLGEVSGSEMWVGRCVHEPHPEELPCPSQSLSPSPAPAMVLSASL